MTSKNWIFSHEVGDLPYRRFPVPTVLWAMTSVLNSEIAITKQVQQVFHHLQIEELLPFTQLLKPETRVTPYSWRFPFTWALLIKNTVHLSHPLTVIILAHLTLLTVLTRLSRFPLKNVSVCLSIQPTFLTGSYYSITINLLSQSLPMVFHSSRPREYTLPSTSC